jgi:tRNA-(ms[2]io[6]A)-hydroxylase
MLHLTSSTDPSWVGAIEERLEEFLIDHAHCEKKAASTALSLMFRYVETPALQVPLTELAREELDHYQQTLELMARRGWIMKRQHPSPYAGKLVKAVRTYEPARLVDTLLVCALIEARSCERIAVLVNHLRDREVAAFFESLLASEARHYTAYVDLACQLGPFDRDALKKRLDELAIHEASVLTCDGSLARMHG